MRDGPPCVCAHRVRPYFDPERRNGSDVTVTNNALTCLPGLGPSLCFRTQSTKPMSQFNFTELTRHLFYIGACVGYNGGDLLTKCGNYRETLRLRLC